MLNLIIKELRKHAPFTALGALLGALMIILFKDLPKDISFNIYYVLHPFHVFLSALVTAAIYKQYKCPMDNKRCNLFLLLVIGYVGSVGIATLSDAVVPFIGETLLDMPHRHMHIGFIEKWYIVNPLAIIGICVAYFFPKTKFPHLGHVLLSTWASLFHILMASGGDLGMLYLFLISIFLFIAVWLPCCISDIVFPLLFIKDSEIKPHIH